MYSPCLHYIDFIPLKPLPENEEVFMHRLSRAHAEPCLLNQGPEFIFASHRVCIKQGSRRLSFALSPQQFILIFYCNIWNLLHSGQQIYTAGLLVFSASLR